MSFNNDTLQFTDNSLSIDINGDLVLNSNNDIYYNDGTNNIRFPNTEPINATDVMNLKTINNNYILDWEPNPKKYWGRMFVRNFNLNTPSEQST